MPITGHAHKTLERTAERYAALYAPDGALAVPRRVCLRCGRGSNGYGYYTLYGCIEVERAGKQTRVHGCGEIVHYRCDLAAQGQREITTLAPAQNHADSARSSERVRAYNAQRRAVETGIEYNESTRLYYPRVNKTRLEPVPSLKKARAARQQFMRKHG